MKLIHMQCPNCGASLEIKEGDTSAKCPYCGTGLSITKELPDQDAENMGYLFEKGRMRAQNENSTVYRYEEPKKKKKLWVQILLWIMFLPIMATIFIWKSDKTKNMSRNLKIGLTCGVWILYAMLYFGGGSSGTAAETKTDSTPVQTAASNETSVISPDHITYGGWLTDVLQPADKGALFETDDQSLIGITLSVRTDQKINDVLTQIFGEHSRDISAYTLQQAYVSFNDLSLNIIPDDVNFPVIEELLNAGADEQLKLVFTSKASEEHIKKLMNFTELDTEILLIYGNDQETVQIPWKEEAPVQPEPTAEAPASGMREDIKAAIDSYESFINDYCDFMVRYSESEDTTAMMIDYLNFMSKYAQYEEDMEALDDSDLTPEEEAYYTQVMLRCSQKLLETSAKME